MFSNFKMRNLLFWDSIEGVGDIWAYIVIFIIIVGPAYVPFMLFVRKLKSPSYVDSGCDLICSGERNSDCVFLKNTTLFVMYDSTIRYIEGYSNFISNIFSWKMIVS